jgi:hypothetical protein
MAAGLFFTSDCLSEEKREGTIGFLFLTDLRSYDVVLGKLMATSLRSCFPLLAVFPILAITLLMGGVTGAEFWKTMLALINAVFISLVAGLFVSSISRDSQKALAATLLLLILLTAGGPLIDSTIAAILGFPYAPILSRLSPIYVFRSADAWGMTPFWSSLLASQVAGWTLLGLTCRLIPRTWQDGTRKSSTPNRGWTARWKFGRKKTRTVLRHKLLGANPILWLACRERWQAAVLWSLAILLLGAFGGILLSSANTRFWMMWGYVGGAFTLILYLGIASQAGRFFVDARRSGFLEQLLATPLTARQIIQGQWRGLVRQFGVPLLLCLTAQALGSFLFYRAWSNMAATIATATPAATASASATTSTGTGTNITLATTSVVVVRTWGISGSSAALPVNKPDRTQIILVVTVTVAGAVAVAGNLIALVWVGMWMGLNSRNSSLSTLKTITYVQVIPWFVVSFVATLLVPMLLLPLLMRGSTSPPSQLMLLYPLLTSMVSTALYLAKDVILTLWARKKLYSEFRERASRVASSVRPMRPPVIYDNSSHKW